MWTAPPEWESAAHPCPAFSVVSHPRLSTLAPTTSTCHGCVQVVAALAPLSASTPPTFCAPLFAPSSAGPPPREKSKIASAFVLPQLSRHQVADARHQTNHQAACHRRLKSSCVQQDLLWPLAMLFHPATCASYPGLQLLAYLSSSHLSEGVLIPPRAPPYLPHRHFACASPRPRQQLCWPRSSLGSLRHSFPLPKPRIICVSCAVDLLCRYSPQQVAALPGPASALPAGQHPLSQENHHFSRAVDLRRQWSVWQSAAFGPASALQAGWHNLPRTHHASCAVDSQHQLSPHWDVAVAAAGPSSAPQAVTHPLSPLVFLPNFAVSALLQRARTAAAQAHPHLILESAPCRPAPELRPPLLFSARFSHRPQKLRPPLPLPPRTKNQKMTKTYHPRLPPLPYPPHHYLLGHPSELPWAHPSSPLPAPGPVPWPRLGSPFLLPH
mmetsp:Transcript_99705/g.249972  ORF Transcript_99705/g.249972 Transcript_99705/m.249972 type:complete len:440 (+) Transcript_99705:1683-3002(+)